MTNEERTKKKTNLDRALKSWVHDRADAVKINDSIRIQSCARAIAGLLNSIETLNH